MPVTDVQSAGGSEPLYDEPAPDRLPAFDLTKMEPADWLDVIGGVSGLAVQNVGGTVQPFRIVRSTGHEIRWELETFEHPTLGPMDLPCAGYDTKAAATGALLRMADAIIEAQTEQLRSVGFIGLTNSGDPA